MKAIPIWSTLIFIISCSVLYAVGALSPAELTSTSELKSISFYIDEMGVPHIEKSQISADVDETFGNSFMVATSKK